MKVFQIPRFKDTILFICWVSGLIAIGSLCWFISRPLRADLLLRTINHAWFTSGDARRLEAPIPPNTMKPGLARLGTWYTLRGGNKVLVFTIFSEGIFLPCAAIINLQGKVEEIIPLSIGGNTRLDRIPSGMIRLHIRRIEGNYE